MATRRGVILLFVTAWAATAPGWAGDEYEDALAAVRADERRRVEVFERAAKSVVCVFKDAERGGGGSGVVIDPEGYGLTNFHVVQPFLESRVGCGGMADGRMYALRVLGIDPSGDIVMFKLEGKERFDYAELGDSDELRLGQYVAAMGNPFVLAEDYQPTITLGVVSGLHRYQKGQGLLLEYADCIQVSTSINPGNSGGPLFDMEGRLVGINGRASFEERGRVNVGLGYAVSINQIKRFIPSLRAGFMVEHGTLGATVRTAGGDLIVNAVQAFSPAERAGMQLGDVVLAVAGRDVRTPNDFNNIMTTLPANWPTAVRISTSGVERETVVRLERVPTKALQYMPDFSHNHAELAKIMRRTPSRLIGVDNVIGERLAAAGSIESGGGEKRWGSLTAILAEKGWRVESESAGADSELWGEWLAAASPLISMPELNAGWRLLGGDEVDGRIAYLVEQRRGADRSLRWKFDWRSLELLQVEVESSGAGLSAWTPLAVSESGDKTWGGWKRRAANGEVATIKIESIEFIPVATHSAPAKREGDE